MDERKRILKLVEDGTISAEEALNLLEAISATKQSKPQPPSTFVEKVEEPKEPFEKFEEKKKTSTGFEDLFGKFGQNKKLDEFMSELRQDLTDFSGRMMTLMNSTMSKVKEFDVEFPFGEKVEFDRTYAFNADEVRGIELDIPNGVVTFDKGSDPVVQVAVHVKTLKKESDEQTIGQFLDGFIELKDGKVQVATQSKTTHVNVKVTLPEKHYDVIIARLLNGAITLNAVDAKLIKAKTYNGDVRVQGIKFEHMDLQSANGAIEARDVNGDDLEAETANGRIYIDGAVQEVEAESVNGHVVVTTTSEKAHKVKARTVAGAVELYVPRTLSLDGEVQSNFGRTDVGLADVQTRAEEDQFLLKTVHFDKIVEGSHVLKLVGESRTGSIIVRYIAQA